MRGKIETGITHATLELSNPVKPQLVSLTVKALADTGALHLCIPEHVALQLQLAEKEQREVFINPASPNIPSSLAKLLF